VVQEGVAACKVVVPRLVAVVVVCSAGTAAADSALSGDTWILSQQARTCMCDAVVARVHADGVLAEFDETHNVRSGQLAGESSGLALTGSASPSSALSAKWGLQ
jgi:hypothetical protein